MMEAGTKVSGADLSKPQASAVELSPETKSVINKQKFINSLIIVVGGLLAAWGLFSDGGIFHPGTATDANPVWYQDYLNAITPVGINILGTVGLGVGAAVLTVGSMRLDRVRDAEKELVKEQYSLLRDDPKEVRWFLGLAEQEPEQDVL